MIDHPTLNRSENKKFKKCKISNYNIMNLIHKIVQLLIVAITVCIYIRIHKKLLFLTYFNIGILQNIG